MLSAINGKLFKINHHLYRLAILGLHSFEKFTSIAVFC